MASLIKLGTLLKEWHVLCWRHLKSLWAAWRHLSTASPVAAYALLGAALLSSVMAPLLILLNQGLINAVAYHLGSDSKWVVGLMALQALDEGACKGFVTGGWVIYFQEKAYQAFHLSLVRLVVESKDIDTAKERASIFNEIGEESQRAFWNLAFRFFPVVGSSGALIGLGALVATLPTWLLALMLLRAGFSAWVAIRFGWAAHVKAQREDLRGRRDAAIYRRLASEESLPELMHNRQGALSLFNEMSESIHRSLENLKRRSWWRGWCMAVSGLLGVILALAMYLYCLARSLPVGEFVRDLEAVGALSASLVGLFSQVGGIIDGAAVVRQVDEILEKLPAPSSSFRPEPEDVAFPVHARSFCMEYSRDGGRGTVYALQNVDLTIPAGAKVALVGRNGSGKSTLLCALLGMNRRSMVGGTLRVGGKDVRQWSQAALNQRIGFCFQDIFAYPGTVLQNVALCNRENPDAELAWRAARMIGAHDLLEEIGLHTLLEAGGNELSGGQRQRLAVLRAVYQALEGRVGLWVGDECTSAVDAVAAMRLYQGILALPCTVLLSVHSLRLARLVGQAQGGIIVVMDEGKILEVGTHDELIVRRGRYYDLLILEGLLQAI